MNSSNQIFHRGLTSVLWLVSIFAFAQAVLASEENVVTWDELSPTALASQEVQAPGAIQHTNPETNTSAEPLPQLDKFDPFNDGLLVEEQWDQEAYDVVLRLVNKPVTIDGHVLPLEWKDDRVTEFLLVPWVGACIHTPAPPPNQIIRISYAAGLQINEQFESLRFTGTLRHDAAKHDLYLIDGRRQIPASYALTEASFVGPAGEISSSAVRDLPLTARIQIWVNSLFVSSMASIAADGGYRALISAVLLSFAYGVLHTLGPGHGKTVVVSYFAGSGGTFSRGMAMGVRIAVFHVLSAIIIVFVFDLAVRQVTGSAPSNYRSIRLASYGLIILIGATMLWRAIAHVVQQRRQVPEAGILKSHHHHHDHAHDQAHVHHTGCAACAAADEAAKGGGWIAAAVGLVPCTGALLVMLYGLANDLIGSAILMVIAISSGMAVAMSAIGILAIWGRNASQKRMSRSSSARQSFEIGARLAGSTCVLAIGCLLFLVTLVTPIAEPYRSASSETVQGEGSGSEGL